MPRPPNYITHRLVYIGPINASLVMTAIVGGSLLFLQILKVLEFHRAIEGDALWEVLFTPTLSTFLITLLVTWAFNSIAPRIGGVSMRLETASPARPMTESATNADTGPDGFMKSAPGTAEKKACPECETMVRGDRTFCPDCGHEFSSD